MSLLLNIDTAFEIASVALSRSGEILATEKSEGQKNHASFLQPAIKQVCANVGVELSEIDATAVANGPGSYTGLRVGLSSAKALCYVLHKPLILVNTLDMLAHALRRDIDHAESNVLICPVIDARRMEVYTALYDLHLNIVKEHSAVILDEKFLADELKIYQIIVGGSGSSKLKAVLGNENIIYSALSPNITQLVTLAHHAFGLKRFADVAYSEPFYLKPVYIRPS